MFFTPEHTHRLRIMYYPKPTGSNRLDILLNLQVLHSICHLVPEVHGLIHPLSQWKRSREMSVQSAISSVSISTINGRELERQSWATAIMHAMQSSDVQYPCCFLNLWIDHLVGKVSYFHICRSSVYRYLSALMIDTLFPLGIPEPGSSLPSADHRTKLQKA